MYNSEKNNWNYTPLRKGLFGYDNMAMSLGYAMSRYSLGMTEDDVASLIHEGWCQNYLYWRDNEPWKNSYTKPFNPLNDERRNMCSKTLFNDLPEEEKEKDRILARFLFNHLVKS